VFFLAPFVSALAPEGGAIVAEAPFGFVLPGHGAEKSCRKRLWPLW
jgi:hypothetical protein